jgi:hypothetical protein
MGKLSQSNFQDWAKENPEIEIFLEFSGFKCKAIEADFYHSRDRIFLLDGTKLEETIKTHTKETK